MVNPLTFPQPKLLTPLSPRTKDTPPAQLGEVQVPGRSHTTSWLEHVAQQILTHKGDVPTFQARNLLEQELRAFCSQSPTSERLQLAAKLRELAASPQMALDLRAFSEKFLHGLPLSITHFLDNAQHIQFPARLLAMPQWLSQHCPKTLSVSEYAGYKIDVRHHHLQVLRVGLGPNITSVHVPQGTTLKVLGEPAPIRFEGSGAQCHLRSTAPLQPVSAHFYDNNNELVCKEAYPHRVFFDSPACNPLGPFATTNMRTKNHADQMIACRHSTTAWTKHFIDWFARGADNSGESLGAMANELIGSESNLRKSSSRLMEALFQSTYVNSPSHMTTREGTSAYLASEADTLSPGCAQLYGCDIYSMRLEAGHVTHLALWRTDALDGRPSWHLSLLDPNIPHGVFRYTAGTPQEIATLPFFGKFHLAYEHLDSDYVKLQRMDSLHPQITSNHAAVPHAPSLAEKRGTLTFSGSIPEKARPVMFAEAMRSNLSLDFVHDWLKSKTPAEQREVLGRWASGVTTSATESLMEFGHVLLAQQGSKTLEKTDIVAILNAETSRFFLRRAFTHDGKGLIAASMADGVRATGQMLALLMERQVISCEQAVEVLLGKGWKRKTYAAEELDSNHYQSTEAAREVLQGWCRRRFITPADAEKYLHDAPARRVQEVRDKTQKHLASTTA